MSQSPNAESEAELPALVARNIRALIEVRSAFDRTLSGSERVAQRMTAFSGSMTFVYLQAAFFGGWILVNTGRLGIRPFDRFPFPMLAMVASLEAIFLAAFVLITQNRMQKLADKRADLDLQVNLLAEQEITHVIRLVDAIASHLGVSRPSAIDAFKGEVAPETVLAEIEKAEVQIEQNAPDGRGG